MGPVGPTVVTRIWFVRHGEVEAPFVGTFVGRTDVPLSDLGRHQAQAVATFLENQGIDAILTSPRTRSRHTAAPLAEATGLTVKVREPLAEMDFGQWETRTWNEIQARDPTFATQWAEDPTSLACPGGESAGAFAARVQVHLQEIVQEFEGRTVAVFAHAGTNRAFLAHALRIPYMGAFALCQDYGCLNAGSWSGDGAQIALMNLVPGPMSEAQGDGQRLE